MHNVNVNVDFESFFRTTFVRLTFFVIRLGARREEAEDAAQDAMLQAYRQWTTLRDPGAWVRMVAYRSFLAAAASGRGNGRRPCQVENPAHAGGEDDDLVAFGEQQRVLSLLRRLPTTQRLVMAWFYDGFTVPEIAAVLGKSAQTVRSDLRHARVRLRRELAAETRNVRGRTAWPTYESAGAAMNRPAEHSPEEMSPREDRANEPMVNDSTSAGDPERHRNRPDPLPPVAAADPSPDDPSSTGKEDR
jgi:RNA polymerase sigma factor (sigma-70 family)